MSIIENEVIHNTKVFGLEDSVKASKYPMQTNIDSCTDEITPRVNSLATAPAGSGHDNFLHGIVVQFDLTLSNKAWVEAERYHFLEIISSQSTMHRIAKFDLDKSYMEYVDERMIEIMKELKKKYEDEPSPENYLKLLYSNPCGFKLTARMSTNYCQLKTIYKQRKGHRLPEWRSFCEWIESLPKSEWITAKVQVE